MRRCLFVALLMGCGASTHPPVEAAQVDELLAVFAAACAGPEGVEDCSVARFEDTFARELPELRRRRSELVAHWMDALRAGGHSAAYGLAWAGAREALPLLREGLLADRYFYGWESSDAASLAARMRDEQYPHHLARIGAIEALSGRPITEAVALTPEEQEALVRESLEEGEPGGPPDVARWLLIKLARVEAPPAP